jgi:hypothetical protein
VSPGAGLGVMVLDMEDDGRGRLEPLHRLLATQDSGGQA